LPVVPAQSISWSMSSLPYAERHVVSDTSGTSTCSSWLEVDPPSEVVPQPIVRASSPGV
jgi:hypothetical protein